jgi:hypothetical protein
MRPLLVWLAACWQWLLSFFEPPYRFEVSEGRFPAKLHRRRIYVLTEDGEPWEARLICPCGCGEALDLSLLRDDHPTWTMKADAHGRATLHPSIWRHVGCRSHFFVRGGRIRWV